MLSTFDHAATFGLETYLREYQIVGTFDSPRLVGWLSACSDRSEHTAGFVHGLALGAQLQQDRQRETIEAMG